MTGRLRGELKIKDQITRNSVPLLSENHEIQPSYGTTIIDQDALIQRRRASSMNSSTFNKLHLATTSIKDGLYQPVDTSISTEIKMLLKSSIPLIMTFLLQYSLTIACVFFVGNIGKNELAAVSLANLLANITSFGLIEGIASSLATLCPQAFGRKDYKMVGLHTIRCFVMLMVLYIFIFIFWTWGSYPLLSAVVTEHEACVLASEYLKVLVWSIPGFIVFEVLKQYLQAQGIFHASTVVLFICAPFNILLTHILVWNSKIGFGFLGAPTAVVITNSIMAILLLLYTCFIDGYQCWCGFSLEIFKNWSKALNLAGPGILMIEAEWLAFEIISFASSRFGTSSLAAQSVVTTICITIYQVPFAVSVAGSTRIAWFIGSSSKQAAITSSKAVVYVAIIVGVIDGLLLGLFPGYITNLFSNNEKVVKLATKVIIIGAIYQVPDCLACVLGGVLRGQGRQYIGGYLNLFSYYVLALPTAFFFGFYLDWELFGLWIGMIVALCFLSITEFYYVFESNWDEIIEESLREDLDTQLDNDRVQLQINRSVVIDDDQNSLRTAVSRSSIKSLLSPVIISTSSIAEPTSFHI
jgi:MATE family multidrug resistance protein